MGLRIACREARSAFGSGMRNAACFGLSAVLAVTLAYPVAGASGQAFANEEQRVADAPQKVVTGTLTAIDSSLADGGFLVGTVRDFDVVDAFKPLSDAEHENWGEQWESEGFNSRANSTNYSVSSSDPTVATIEVVHSEGGRTLGSFHVEAKSVGRASFTIQYHYEGRYATYEAEQTIDVVVTSESNPITAIACDNTFELFTIGKCAICGEPHPNMENTVIPVTVTAQDPSKPYTSDQIITVESSDSNIINAWGDTCPDGGGAFHAHVIANAVGKATVTLSVTSSEGGEAVVSATIEVVSTDMGAPKMIVEDNQTKAFALDDLWIFRSFLTDSLVSYGGRSPQGWWPYCTNLEDFDGFKGTVNGKEVTVLSAESDNDAIAAVGGNGAEEGHRLVFSQAGTVHVTYKDIWGNEEIVTVTGVSREAEAKKLSLSESEITVKQGEMIDLQKLVQGLEKLDPSVTLGESLMFRSDNGDIASVEWRQEADGHGQVSWLTAKKEGDVTVKVGLRKSAQPPLNNELATAPIVEFGTLTVHVVADEAPDVPASGISLDKEAATIVGAQSTKLTATVAPEGASDKSVTWSSSDKAVATVDGAGNVTAVGKGEAVITATTADGKHAATCAITVCNPITRVELEKSISLIKGSSTTLEATLAGDLPGELDTPKTLSWWTGNESVASVSGDGAKATVTALKSGLGSVRLVVQTETRVDNDTMLNSLFTRDCVVTVTNPATSISLSDTAVTTTVGDDPHTLKATVAPVDADGAVAWSSSDTNVATVDANGLVTVKAAGSATITATAGTVSAACKLTVNSRQITAAPQESGFAATVIVSDAETARVLDKYANEGVNLVVESITELTEPAKAAIEKLTESGSKVADTFDIRFEKDNGDTIVLSTDKDGKVTLTVKVALTGSMRALLNQGMALKVHYVGPDGTIEEKQTWVEGDSLYFVTEHFSDYVVMGVPQDQKGEKPATTPASLPGTSTDGDGKTLAATGDASASLLATLSAAALIACCGVVIAVRKRRTER